ncbi:MAG: HXXEE domain-containing protein [Pseudomonadota bacterium]
MKISGHEKSLKATSFKTLIILIPLIYALHHFEEHVLFDFRSWRLLYFPNNNNLTTEQVFLLLSSITVMFTFLHHLLMTRASAIAVLFLVFTTQLQNALFHIGGTIYFNHFSPGLYTAILIYIPVSALITYRAFVEGVVTSRGILALFFISGIVFWTFEFLGGVVILGTSLIAFVWVFWDWSSRTSESE